MATQRRVGNIKLTNHRHSLEVPYYDNFQLDCDSSGASGEKKSPSINARKIQQLAHCLQLPAKPFTLLKVDNQVVVVIGKHNAELGFFWGERGVGGAATKRG